MVQKKKQSIEISGVFADSINMSFHPHTRVYIFGFAKVDMAGRMMRMHFVAAMSAIAPQEAEASRHILG